MKNNGRVRMSGIAKSLFRATALCCASMTALATGSSGSAVPSFLTYQNDGKVYVYFLLSIRSGTPPACAQNIGGSYYRLVFDSTTTAGKTMLGGLVASHVAGEQVWPDGTGDCGVDGTTESLKDFHTGD